ncbi:MAG: hypothetical protein C0483_01475 [Pirellula sp.]|nr:hypothetical protein [Pirellula sp.]
MRRFLCMLLTAVGLGMIVGGTSIAPPEPANPMQVVEHALRGGAHEQNIAHLNELMRMAIVESQSSLSDSRMRDRDEIYRVIASALLGFGTAFTVFGVLGLTIPLLHRSLRQAAAPVPASPPSI